MTQKSFKVGEVSELSGVSVRTLHHYEEIGLLTPARTDAGHRTYGPDDLLRLQQILAGRTLGLSLEQVRKMLDDPKLDRRRLLVRHRTALQAKAAETARMLAAVDLALTALDRSEWDFDPRALFDGFDPAQYEAESVERWGDTAAYREAQRRTQKYSRADWEQQQKEQTDLMRRLADALRRGVDPNSDEAFSLVEEHRRSIDRWFYPCSPAHHARLAEMYEGDERFRATFEAQALGLTTWLVTAIRAAALPR